MIEISHEVFQRVAERVRQQHPGTKVKGEYVRTPDHFPLVTLDETNNVPVHLDSRAIGKYARVTYRAQIFSNLESGKRAQAREIYDTVDREMQALGLYPQSFSTVPTVYRSDVYSITATFAGVVREDGTIFRA